jgi:hypothetical protein
MPKRRSDSISRRIRIIRRSLLAIVAALDGLVPALNQLDSREGAAQPIRRRSPTLSPKRRAALKLQGRYMGHLRGLKPRQQARVKALRAAKGVQGAIQLAKSLVAASQR